MAIRLDRNRLLDVLDAALRDAADPRLNVDARWEGRIRWLSQQVAGGDAQGRTYVAATGAALLAKATDAQVDTLAQTGKPDAGPRGYSLRGVAELLAARVRGRVHLGTLSKWPLNNAPFLRGPSRIERFTVAGYLRHVYEEFVAWMTELDAMDSVGAHRGLVAFLRVRMAVQRDEDADAAAAPSALAGRSLADMLDMAQLWMTEDPEHGGRGQAVLAALLDTHWRDVTVVPKHDPAPFDVRVGGTPPKLVCEVKQQPIEVPDVLELARRAAERGAAAALYAAFAADQRPLAVDAARREAVRRHGLMLDVVHNAGELAAHLAVHAGVPSGLIASRLPGRLLERCRSADVSGPGRARLRQLLSSSTAAASPRRPSPG